LRSEPDPFCDVFARATAMDSTGGPKQIQSNK
jgi:hypothetical protein